MTYVKAFLHYLFTPAPGADFKYYIPLAIFAGLLLTGGVIFSLIYRKKRRTDFIFKRLFKSLGKRAFLVAVLTIVYLLVRYENIPYFSMRFCMYLIGLLFLYFVYRYIKLSKVDYPKEKENFELSHPTKKAENRYLPSK